MYWCSFILVSRPSYILCSLAARTLTLRLGLQRAAQGKDRCPELGLKIRKVTSQQLHCPSNATSPSRQQALKKVSLAAQSRQHPSLLALSGNLTSLKTAWSGGAAPALPAVLSVEEEAVLRRHYEGKLQPVCKAFAFPHKIQVTLGGGRMSNGSC